MSAKYSNKAIFKGVLNSYVSGTLIGLIIQKNGIVRVNKSYITKRDQKALAKSKNLI